jgi:hypothetical protein
MNSLFAAGTVKRVALALIVSGLVVKASAFGAEIAWSQLVSPDKSFSVLMPGTVDRTQKTTENPSGPIVTTIWTATDGASFFAAGVTDYPVDIEPHRELILDREKFLTAVNGKLVSESLMTFAGHPASEFTGTSETHRYESRVIVVGTRRAYQIVVRQALGSLDDQKAARFLQSFRLNPTP